MRRETERTGYCSEREKRADRGDRLWAGWGVVGWVGEERANIRKIVGGEE